MDGWMVAYLLIHQSNDWFACLVACLHACLLACLLVIDWLID